MPRVNPAVLVVMPDNFFQRGAVTYLVTREWVDLISGKGSDIVW